jgi:hypothetical protein
MLICASQSALRTISDVIKPELAGRQPRERRREKPGEGLRVEHTDTGFTIYDVVERFFEEAQKRDGSGGKPSDQ